jgi:MFS transporter, DHA1 family, multidrug resistance protein
VPDRHLRRATPDRVPQRSPGPASAASGRPGRVRASSVACGFAPNIYVLTGFRLIQGVGTAGIAIARSIVRDLHHALACGLGMGGGFAYVAGSAFVLQNVYGLSPQMYGIVFALNAAGLIIGAQVNGRIAGRIAPSFLLTAGLTSMVVCGAVLVAVVVGSGRVCLVGVIAALFVAMFGWGFVGPNAVALALERYPDSAGAASAVLGSFQFLLAALTTPLAGLGGTADGLPMALLILVLPAAALGCRFILAGSQTRPATAISAPS